MSICDNDPILFNVNNSMTIKILKNVRNFGNSYMKIHPYICFVICLIGTTFNFIHLIVLTRKNLRKSSVNSIMTVIAICDMITMLTYLIYNFHFRININFQFFQCLNPFSYLWLVFLYFHVILSIFLHSLTLWLAVVMAFVRRTTFKTNSFHSPWQSSMIAYKISFILMIGVFITTMPNIIVHTISKTTKVWNIEDSSQVYCKNFYDNSTLLKEAIYTLDFSEIAKKNNCKIFKANLWLTGIFNKLIPSILLLLLSFNLMYKLNEAEKKRKKFFYQYRKTSINERKFKKDKATTLLLGILIVFLLTELPQGIIIILSAIWTNDIFKEIYHYVADFLDLLSLINSSVHFFMYFIMSSRYRITFVNIVFRKNFGYLSHFSSRVTNSLFSREPTNYVSEIVLKLNDDSNKTNSSYRKRIKTDKLKQQKRYNKRNDMEVKDNNSVYSRKKLNKKFMTSSEKSLNIRISDTSTYSSFSSLFAYNNLRKENICEVGYTCSNINDIKNKQQKSFGDENISYL
ncbi:G protein-coupled receptor, rhodopsin-like family and GPCR, rhodopsin-like, 7TM domain and 7TM GPCR, serpentine receptor class w (Srw) family-containing protein [Strongyloides ratti]|uniref:G protein-coupled receptor, rhodopsin-like family and GPCR, rhodopsin-like, 7TM domain and 7TM GPCR, serpentine receptor class w (Srw) family-containing protein n=1 Tax=Strongyloides ratti TaxID=34506 RepID=A0A090KYA6_STRRB|nr:G protein-coupled receptor, rhodopsin-like family and GPCR, rhodopsin-like, 7TM domain and 7TM GPCR, serpentine receptor class w (Srw) family-containing protein [Strongyloides ratti]CEF62505.1 G protein-coupled receptor, rhodopsin-like family and GPCR, rhodopsin-like, 7TM domain and 7TM GPCR, serpentine receptor class w (Srw) family-containing protein [Strongyloides ratti]